jgi:type II secretory pathway pseudopilin PulG
MKMIKSNRLSSDEGFGLVEVLVSIGLVSVLAAVLTSVVMNSLKVQKSIDEKFILQDTKNFLMNAFANSAVCASQLDGPTLDLSSTTATAPYPSDVPYTVIKSGSLAASPVIAEVTKTLAGSHLVVDTITLKNILKSGVGNSYQGTLEIAIVPTSLTLSRKPISMPIIFTASTPTSSARIISCAVEGAGFKGLPTSLGAHSGVYDGMNSQVFPIFVTANGGNATVGGDDGNPCELEGQVLSVVVAETKDNNKMYAKSCTISFWVPANTAYRVLSKPFPVGTGRFEIIESR